MQISIPNMSFLQSASFERTSDVLIKAAIFAETDPLKGITESIWMGTLPPTGTGTVTLLPSPSDTVANSTLPRGPLAKSTPLAVCHDFPDYCFGPDRTKTRVFPLEERRFFKSNYDKFIVMSANTPAPLQHPSLQKTQAQTKQRSSFFGAQESISAPSLESHSLESYSLEPQSIDWMLQQPMTTPTTTAKGKPAAFTKSLAKPPLAKPPLPQGPLLKTKLQERHDPFAPMPASWCSKVLNTLSDSCWYIAPQRLVHPSLLSAPAAVTHPSLLTPSLSMTPSLQTQPDKPQLVPNVQPHPSLHQASQPVVSAPKPKAGRKRKEVKSNSTKQQTSILSFFK